MTEPSRRAVVTGAVAAGLAAGGLAAPPALARAEDAGAKERPFGFETVEEQARILAAAPFDGTVPPLPEVLAALDYDAWRDIRFKPARAFPVGDGGRFRLQLFHRGFLYPRPVTVSLVRGGIAAPIPYDPALFDLGRTRPSAPLPADLGFAGIRLHTALNRPDVIDELIVFVGASYFRFLGRDQLYGLSARALAVNTEARDGAEEFPFFRAFWIEADGPEAGACTIFALLDGPSQAGAYRFTVRPGAETTVSVQASLFPRRALGDAGLAPLTSMFFIGETDRGHSDDYRPELHDSDGLQLATGTGEWLWRPLDNPRERRISAFADTNPKGFGLLQRDRNFASYQDLEAGYERRPGYFVEPEGDWGEGSVVLMELPTDNETADNIVAFWRPKAAPLPGTPFRLAYRVRALAAARLHPGGQVVNTFLAEPAASGAARKAPGSDAALARRFLIDFGGGDLERHLAGAGLPEIVASASPGRILAQSIVPNPHIRGYRVALDVSLEKPATAELRAFLRAGERALTETWIFSWSAA